MPTRSRHGMELTAARGRPNHMGWIYRLGWLSVAAVVTGAAAGCSSSGFNDSAFSPNGGQLTGLYQGHVGCLGLMPGRSKRVYPVELTQGYAVRTNPLRIVGPDGHEVARVGELVSVDTLGGPKRRHGCGRGRSLIMLEGSSIKVLSIAPTESSRPGNPHADTKIDFRASAGVDQVG